MVANWQLRLLYSNLPGGDVSKMKPVRSTVLQTLLLLDGFQPLNHEPESRDIWPERAPIGVKNTSSLYLGRSLD